MKHHTGSANKPTWLYAEISPRQGIWTGSALQAPRSFTNEIIGHTLSQNSPVISTPFGNFHVRHSNPFTRPPLAVFSPTPTHNPPLEAEQASYFPREARQLRPLGNFHLLGASNQGLRFILGLMHMPKWYHGFARSQTRIHEFPIQVWNCPSACSFTRSYSYRARSSWAACQPYNHRRTGIPSVTWLVFSKVFLHPFQRLISLGNDRTMWPLIVQLL